MTTEIAKPVEPGFEPALQAPSGPSATSPSLAPRRPAQAPEAGLSRGPEPGPGPNLYLSQAYAGPGPARALGPAGPGPQAPSPGPEPEASSPQARRAQHAAKPEAPAEPRWLKASILVGLAALTAIALIFVSDGQVKAAFLAGVHDWRRYLAPGVFELVAILWTLLGYRRGRHGNSPWGYWALSAATGGYSVYVITAHSPGQSALLYGGASIAAQLLTFVKFYEDLRKWQQTHLRQTAAARAKLGVLWLTRFAVARRAWLLAVEHGITARADAIDLAHLYRAVYLDTRDELYALAATKHGPDGNPGFWDKVTARRLARRTADQAIAASLGKPVARLPETVVVAKVAVAQAQAPSGPERGPEPEPQASTGPDRARPERETSGPDAGPGGGPEPGPTPEPAPKPTLDVYDVEAIIEAAVAAGYDRALAEKYRGDYPKVAAAVNWLTSPTCPKKEDVKEWSGRGSTLAGELRQILDAIRKHQASTTV